MSKKKVIRKGLKMANLHFHYGVMNSSKSAALITSAYAFSEKGTNVEVLKPSYDKRFSVEDVVSRTGLSWNASAMPNLQDYIPNYSTEIILVDEVQFFTPADIDKLVHIADEYGKIVMCYGLMVDSNQKIFPAAQRLIEVGAKLHRMNSPCQIKGCLNLATHHLRFDKDGNVVHAGEQFELGAGKYQSVCRQHYNKLYYAKEKER